MLTDRENQLPMLPFEDSWNHRKSQSVGSIEDDCDSIDDDSYSSDRSSEYSHSNIESDVMGTFRLNDDYGIRSNNEDSFSDSDGIGLTDHDLEVNLEGVLTRHPSPYKSTKQNYDENAGIELELRQVNSDTQSTVIHDMSEVGKDRSIKSIESDCSTQSFNSMQQLTQVTFACHSVRGHQTPNMTLSKSHSSKKITDFSLFSLPNIAHNRKSNRHRARELHSGKQPSSTRDTYSDSSYMMDKLTSHPMRNELDAMKIELKKTESEIIALEKDYELYNTQLYYLETSAWNLDGKKSEKQMISPIERQWGYVSGALPEPSALERGFRKKAKSVFSPALHKKNNQISFLRKQRGLFFDFDILGCHQDTKCTVASFHSQCKKASVVKTICNVSLTGRSSYFLNWDNGKWCHHGPIARNFLDRLEKTAKRDKCPDVRYLAAGPLSQSQGRADSLYYAELSNGEYWWVNFDQDFHEAVQNMPVHRVAFGSPYPGSNGTPSWIVLGKDGRSAWKGIPAHLHNILIHRDSSLCAACEVSLGSSGSFFIKFLSGEIDYCLPAGMANRCEEIERKGGVVTNILLHVDCNGCIIRHTEMKKKDKS